MTRAAVIVALLLISMIGSVSAETWVFAGSFGATECKHGGYNNYVEHCNAYRSSFTDVLLSPGVYNYSNTVFASFDNTGCVHCNRSCNPGGGGTICYSSSTFASASVCSNGGGGSAHQSGTFTTSAPRTIQPAVVSEIAWSPGGCCPCSGSGAVIVSNDTEYYTASGATECVSLTELYISSGGPYCYVNSTTSSSYSFDIFKGASYRLLFDGAYYDFVCDGNEVFDYDACLFVYGYSCGVDTIILRDDNSQLIDTVTQDSGYDIYEMQINDGEEYTISFYDIGVLLCYEQTFTCTGSHVLIDFDRCNWVYPPSPWDDPYIIYLWAGYDYNIVLFKDAHGNFIENSQLAIYDTTDNRYIQRWTDASDGYTLLGARFDTDHEVLLSLRTFDGIFTLDTTYPANGSAAAGKEDIATTNWTIPIKYNLKLYPVDPVGRPLFDVFCGLSEYTPLNPGSFWGMDLSDRGYVPITNCSGFSLCDILAEKEGYTAYEETAREWKSKSALTKDYRHEITLMEE